MTAPFKARRDEDGVYGTFRINVDSLTAALQQPIAQDLTASFTATAGRSSAQRFAVSGLGQAQNRGRDWSLESTFNWSPAGPVKALLGVSRTHVRLKQRIDLTRLTGIGQFADDQDSFGLFGEATVDVAPRTTLTAGMRYQQDRQQRNGHLGANPQPVPLHFDRTFHALLPKISLAYDFTAHMRAGLLVQKAYNPGGTTLRFDTGRPDNFRAEKLWDYEAFVRAEPAPGLELNGNVFYYDIRDAQRSQPIRIFTSDNLLVTFADLFNAPRAHSYGAEASLGWAVMPQLLLSISAGLLRTRLVDPGPGYGAFTGNEFARSPHLSAAIGADWQASDRLRVSAQARHHSAYYANDVNGLDVRVPATAIVDTRIEYQLDKRITGFVFARNLFNKFALLDRFANVSASAEDPRMVGIGVESRF